MGLIAQEVEQVFPDWIDRDKDGYRYVTERSTTALMVESLRDLRAEKNSQIEALRAQKDCQLAERDQAIADLRAQKDRELAQQREAIADLSARVERLEQLLSETATQKIKNDFSEERVHK